MKGLGYKFACPVLLVLLTCQCLAAQIHSPGNIAATNLTTAEPLLTPAMPDDYEKIFDSQDYENDLNPTSIEQIPDYEMDLSTTAEIQDTEITAETYDVSPESEYNYGSQDNPVQTATEEMP